MLPRLLAACLCLLSLALIVLGRGLPLTASRQAQAGVESDTGLLLNGDEDDASNITIELDIRQEAYLVPGGSADQIRTQLNRLGPLGTQDGRFDSTTVWSLGWSFRYHRDDEGCSLAGATITLTSLTRLPQLANLPASDSLATRWQAYLDALGQHEAGHVQRQVTGANALKVALAAAEPAPTCALLGTTLEALGQAQITAGRAADTQYDDETDHGRSQGAVFP